MAEVDSFLALGDSFTEGMEDELGPDRRHLGWADRVATALAAERPQLVYGNLATRGRLLDQVLAEQLPVALELEPDLVTFHAGPNDVLRPGMDLTGVAARYDEAVAAQRGREHRRAVHGHRAGRGHQPVRGSARDPPSTCAPPRRRRSPLGCPLPRTLGRSSAARVSSGDGVSAKRPELTRLVSNGS